MPTGFVIMAYDANRRKQPRVLLQHPIGFGRIDGSRGGSTGPSALSRTLFHALPVLSIARRKESKPHAPHQHHKGRPGDPTITEEDPGQGEDGAGGEESDLPRQIASGSA